MEDNNIQEPLCIHYNCDVVLRLSIYILLCFTLHATISHYLATGRVSAVKTTY